MNSLNTRAVTTQRTRKRTTIIADKRVTQPSKSNEKQTLRISSHAANTMPPLKNRSSSRSAS